MSSSRLWETTLLRPLVLMRRGAAQAKPGLVILFLEGARGVPASVFSVGAKFWEISNFQCCTGDFQAPRIVLSKSYDLIGGGYFRWLGHSQRESGRFARIDSQRNPTFHTVRGFARIASNLRFVNFSALKCDSKKFKVLVFLRI